VGRKTKSEGRISMFAAWGGMGGGARETREGCPCWLLKLRQMGAQGVHYIKGILSWLVRWYCRASTRDFCPALAALVSPVHIIFPRGTLFHLIWAYRPCSKLGRQSCRVACLLICVSAATACSSLLFLVPLVLTQHLPINLDPRQRILWVIKTASWRQYGGRGSR